MQEIHIFVSGKVQGVGFRVQVTRHAELCNIKGYVRNLPDGRVEICAQAKEKEIKQFVQTIENKPGLAAISHIETKQKPLCESFESFQIR